MLSISSFCFSADLTFGEKRIYLSKRIRGACSVASKEEIAAAKDLINRNYNGLLYIYRSWR